MRSTLSALFVLCLTTAASAAVLNFDNITQSRSNPVPSMYGGLKNWINFDVIRDDYFDAMPGVLGSGYKNGAVSPHYAAANYSEGYAYVQHPKPWSFQGATFTSAWKNNAILTVQGFVGGELNPTYSQTVIINATAPTTYDFDFPNITMLTFLADHTPETTFAGYGGTGDFVVIDNFRYTPPVPEPTTLALLPIASLWFISRRRTAH